MRKYILIFALITLPAHSQPVSYQEAVDLMFSQHGDILALEETVKQYEYEKKGAFGLHLPTITLDARYTHMDDDLALRTSVFIPPAINIPVNHTLQEQDFFRVNANLLWPLFTGGEIVAANSAARARYAGSMTDLEIAKNNISYELADKYFGLQLAVRTSQLRYDVKESLKQHSENSELKERAGTIPRVESMHARVSLNEAERTYNQSLRDVEIAKAALKNLLDMEGEPEPSTPLFILSPEYIEDMVHFKELAANSAPQMKKINSLQDLARAGTEAKKSTYMPTLYAFGNYEFYKDDLTMLDPEWYLGVGASWRIFEGFTGHNAHMAALKTEQSLALKSTQAKKDLSTLAEVYYKQILKAYEKYEAAKGTLEFTEEYVRVRTKAFEAGFATSVDVVDAETALSKNRLEIILAAYEFDISLARLLSLTGEYHRLEEYRNNTYSENIQ